MKGKLWKITLFLICLFSCAFLSSSLAYSASYSSGLGDRSDRSYSGTSNSPNRLYNNDSSHTSITNVSNDYYGINVIRNSVSDDGEKTLTDVNSLYSGSTSIIYDTDSQHTAGYEHYNTDVYGATFDGASTDISVNVGSLDSGANEYITIESSTFNTPVTVTATNSLGNDSYVSLTDSTFNSSVAINATNVTLGSTSETSGMLTTLNNIYTWLTGGLRDQINYFNAKFTLLLYFVGRNLVYDQPTTLTATVGGMSESMNLMEIKYTPFVLTEDTELIANGTTYTFYGTLPACLRIEICDRIVSFMNAFFVKFRAWYYPLSVDSPFYWRYYNTDTGEEEEINLAGVLYNLTWYVGQLYSLQVENSSLSQLTDKVEEVSETFQEYEQKEQQIVDSVKANIQSFAPDLSEIQSLRALGWCSHYLQLLWSSLGLYGTMIVVGLLMGVCMQFIGYFRYKL